MLDVVIFTHERVNPFMSRDLHDNKCHFYLCDIVENDCNINQKLKTYLKKSCEWYLQISKVFSGNTDMNGFC